MNREDWRQLETIFQAAAELPDAEREGFVEQACGRNTEMRRQVKNLLASDAEAGEFIESPIWTDSGLLNTSAKNELSNSLDNTGINGDADGMIGSRIGPFRIEHELGRGGMGTVYLAKRDDGEFQQKVAIKLIRRGMDTDMILRRFRRERQILASLNHPNIGHFLDGGSTTDGLPYFVMEFIDGLPLYKHCNKSKLTVRERLGIFRQVCWAVAAAHSLKFVHRDIKPSNIIVTTEGKPKLLDFGIAKVLDPEFSATDGDLTATHLRIMTPEYASPEQAGGDTVGAASDIYSLGIVLYELVTGHRPYSLSKRVPHEIAKAIREEIPTNPSGSITRDSGLVPDNGGEMRLDSIFEDRGTTADDLRREISGDLEKIIMKALRKRPEDRYASATEFADDITNFLEGRPVNAEYFVTMRTALTARRSRKLSIAILPFRVLSKGDTKEEFVGVGLADALISRLSGVKRLIVRPTTSVLGFAETTPFEASEHLGVDFLLEGNVRVSGSRLRVSVQLFNTASNSAIWAKAFDRDLGDVLELEDSIADEVSRAVLPQLSTEEQDRIGKRGTNDPRAYEAYMRGRFFWSKFSDDGLLRAVAEFNKAIEIDPNYALPYIGLADFYTWSAIFGEIPSEQGFQKAKESARKAIEIDDSAGEAYAALGFIALLYDWNWPDAEYLLKRALELSPNYSPAHEFYSNFLTAQGRFDEGIQEILLAEELDPVSPRAILMSSWTLYQARKFPEAVEKARKANAMQQSLPQTLLHLGNTLIAVGEYEKAVEALRKSAESWERSGMPRYMLAHARAAQHDPEAVTKIVDRMLESELSGHMKPYFIGMAYVAIGDHDAAFEWFERAVNERNEWLIWFATEPKLDAVRNDPRYRKILTATNNPIPSGDSPITAEKQRSIAVLPFRALSTGSDMGRDDEYLSIGIADAVTARLSNVKRFVVRPTSSVLHYSGVETDPFRAGKELGVEFVVDGIIRHVGETIRVTAQLLDVNERATRWSASFSETLSDLLELEDSIAGQVTRSLLPKLSGADEIVLTKRGTNDAEAHDAYLQGRYFWNQFTPDSFGRSLEKFRRAIELDPNYALAHVGIADYYTWSTIYGILPPNETLSKVAASAQQALDIEPDLPEAHAAMGLYYSNSQNFAKAEEKYRRSVELNANYDLAHEWLSSVLVGTGRFKEGVAEVLTAERLNPLSIRPKVLSAWTIYQTREYEAALGKAKELLDFNSGMMQSNLQTANILLALGAADQALAHSARALEIEPEAALPIYVHCFALVAAGQDDKARELTNKWESIAKDRYIPPYFLGMCNAALGNTDKAFDLLQKSQQEQSPWIIWIGTEPKLDRLRTDPRMNELIAASNLPVR